MQPSNFSSLFCSRRSLVRAKHTLKLVLAWHVQCLTHQPPFPRPSQSMAGQFRCSFRSAWPTFKTASQHPTCVPVSLLFISDYHPIPETTVNAPNHSSVVWWKALSAARFAIASARNQVGQETATCGIIPCGAVLPVTVWTLVYVMATHLDDVS